jgi:hypothetical protein
MLTNLSEWASSRTAPPTLVGPVAPPALAADSADAPASSTTPASAAASTAEVSALTEFAEFAGVTVITDWPGRVWTVLAELGPLHGKPPVLGWVYHLGTDFEVTTAGDPILVVRKPTFCDAISFLKVDAASARRALSPFRGVG